MSDKINSIIVEKVFQFRYFDGNEMKVLQLHIMHNLVPIRPIISSLGLHPYNTTNYAKTYPHELLKTPYSRGQEVLHMKPEPLQQWLTSLRCRGDQTKLQHFQQHFIPALNEFLEEVKPTPIERVELESQYEANLLTEEEARELLSKDYPIYLDKEGWSQEDWLRLVINQLGETDYDIINFCVVTAQCLPLYRVAEEYDSKGRGYEFKRIHLRSITNTTFKEVTEAGWHFATVFFLKYPQLYVPETYIVKSRVGTDENGRPLSGLVELPSKGYSWFDPLGDFKKKVDERFRLRVELLRKEEIEEEKSIRREVEELMKRKIKELEDAKLAEAAQTQSTLQSSTTLCAN